MTASIIPGGTYRLRNGAEVAIIDVAEIPYSVNGTRVSWYGWLGIFLATGGRCTWELDGSYSPVYRNELDIMLTSPSM